MAQHVRDVITDVAWDQHLTPELPHAMGEAKKIWHLIGKCFFFFCLFAFSKAPPLACGDSQARGLIGAVATGLNQSHSNMESEPRL